ncbi:hypothetical protein [Sporosarcina sp. ACRSL]|nr:hypothetical protein [Sporosarcina sp. ACRSL]
MINQNAQYRPNEKTNTKKLMEWESPNQMGVKHGDTTGERRL